MATAIRLLKGHALASAPEGVAGILGGLVNRLQASVQLQAWIWLGVAVVLIVGYALLYNLVVKKKIAAANATPEAAPVFVPAAAPEAPAAEAEPATAIEE